MLSKILYTTYDGILEPLGQSQVVCCIEKLANFNKIFLISFEKESDWKNNELRINMLRRMTIADITWLPLRYHKRPTALATSLDMLVGVAAAAWIVLRHRIRIIHARSYVASVIALALKRISFLKLRYVFDMRGFWADERVDGGLWPAGGYLYRSAKWFERHFLLNADCVIALTQAAMDEMRTFPYLQDRMPDFRIITTCADLELFYPDKESRPKDHPFTLGYVGSVGVWYLFDEVLRCFQLMLEELPDARLHILNRGGHEHIQERMKALAIDPSLVQIEAVDHAGVAQAMRRMDAGIFFIKPVYSKKASAPTKLGEFLGCGVPCLCNSGVGDIDSMIEKERVGVLLKRFDMSAMRESVSSLLLMARQPGIRERCRTAAERYFSLEEGVSHYQRIYEDLAQR
ncbi:glycosyltransferase [Candidatus Electronema sp. TJ]|uniref:glycosyltransferase n=1 Tax=Candidatus Electronema sp. TJ TaxID=3401573 RepID=UPI003AA986DC